MPTFSDKSIQISELRAAIDEVGRMPHVLPCATYISCRTVGESLPVCDCYKSWRLAQLRDQLAEITGEKS